MNVCMGLFFGFLGKQTYEIFVTRDEIFSVLLPAAFPEYVRTFTTGSDGNM